MTNSEQLRVLVVDDEADIRRLITMFLGEAGTVLECESGLQALEQVLSHRPHIVFLDIAMPGLMDGRKALKVLRQDAELQGIFVVLVTGLSREEDSVADALRFADAYLAKPFGKSDILACLQACRDKLQRI